MGGCPELAALNLLLWVVAGILVFVLRAVVL